MKSSLNNNDSQQQEVIKNGKASSKTLLKIGKSKYPLSIILPIATFIITMFVAFSVGLAFYHESTRLAIETNKNFLIEKNRQTKFVMAALYKEAYDHLTFLSKTPSVKKIASALSQSSDENLVSSVTDFNGMALDYLKIRQIYTSIKFINLKNNTELSSVIKNKDSIEVVKPEFLKIYETPLFEKELLDLPKGKVVYSEIRVRKIKNSLDSYQIFELALPIYDSEHIHQVGLIILEVNFQRFMEILGGIALKNTDMYLFGGKGKLVYRSDKSSADKLSQEHIYEIFPQLEEAKVNGQQGDIIELVEGRYGSKMMYGVYQVYQDTMFGSGQPLQYVIKPSENKLLEAIDQIELNSIMVSLGLALVAFILSLFFTRKISKPLGQIINSVTNLESDSRLEHLPINSHGEIGLLARSFYNMQIKDSLKEEQILAEKHRAEKAVHSKSEFFASMSHEIRTPMNGVLGMLGLIMKTDLDKQQKHYATLARSSADSLLAIIDDILDLSKIDAGKIELENLDFNLREQLGVFAESMAYRAQDKGLELILDVTQIDQSMVRGDPGRLGQILNNLVGNAIKFTEKGEISIRASLNDISDTHWLFSCEVRDTGMGIPADKIEGLFDSYSQVDSSTTRKFGGTGLGLAIVKQLSELMGGSVALKSKLGKGSIFSFEVKLEKSNLSKLVVPEQEIKGKRILVVDDNSTNLEVIVGQLNHWGARAVAANSGSKALKILKASHNADDGYFEIAILDMSMSEMDGAQLGKIIRENEAYNQIKLVMMTSMAGSGDIDRFKRIGFSAYFPKPATTNDLFLAIQVLVEDGSTLEQLDGMVTRYNISSMTSTHIFSNAHVLMVEDNPINKEVALGILEDMGVKVDTAENGAEALEILKEKKVNYGLIIMDCQMPIMDGYQTTKEIRSGKHDIINSEIPIVAITANALKGDREKCLDAGMCDYLTKPVDPNQLEDKLRQWLPASQQDHHLREDSGEDGKPESSLDEKEAPVFNLTEKDEPLWDKSSFYERIRNNQKLANKLIQLLLEDLPKLVAELQKGVEEKDFETIISVSHRVKGSTGNMSAIKISSLAAFIEKHARADELEPVIKILPEFVKQTDFLLELMNKEVA